MMNHLVACVVLIAWAATADAQLAGKKPAAIRTMSCIVMQGIEHAFSSEELQAKAAAPLTVGHNLRVELAMHDIKFVHVEYFVGFVAPTRAVRGISKADFKDVLEGKKRDWSQVGQAAGRIQLYLHGGELQKKAFLSLYTHLGADPRKLTTIEPRYLEDYGKLRRAAAADRNGLTFGLDTWHPEGLRALPIEGISPDNPLTLAKYPLRIPIYVYERKGSNAAKDLQRRLMDRIRENIEKMGRPGEP